PHFFPEQAIPHHRPSALLLFEADEPDHVEPVSEADVERKLAALEAHRSQLRSTMFVDPTSPDYERQLEAFRTRGRDRLAGPGALTGGRGARRSRPSRTCDARPLGVGDDVVGEGEAVAPHHLQVVVELDLFALA